MTDRNRIVGLTLDERTVIRRSPDIEHERRVAIYDLLDDNRFRPHGREGRFRVPRGTQESRRVLDNRDEGEQDLARVQLPLTPFRRVIKDYFTVCESYFNAIRSATPAQIEAIDMGRRGLHNEGSERLRDALADRIEPDLETARRLFTLICVLQIRG